jgi:REP element-mobilizing transposase RayT
MNKKHIIERKHRLPLECYKGIVRVSFTLCIKDRKQIFINTLIVNKFSEILKDILNEYDCKNWVYMFMPDHLHQILEGNSENSDLWKAMVIFKQKTGYWFSQNMKRVKWQKDFYDYIHRKEDDLIKHIIYILENPERKGLVSCWQEYLFKGSLSFNLDEILM